MTATRPPYQLELDLPMPGRGEAPRLDWQEVEAVTATAEPESLAPTEHLMEAICDSDNIETALRAVVRNKGAPGVDGITVQRLPGILKARWSDIENQLLQGRYQPQPVRRVKIPKPAGGTRNLGIPTVIDRVIQQAVLQRLQPQWDPTFSEHSYGFRPGRSAHQAVAQAQALSQIIQILHLCIVEPRPSPSECETISFLGGSGGGERSIAWLDGPPGAAPYPIC
jgi:RNA-directed DNA polymerase